MKKEYIEKEKAVGVAHNYCHTPDGRCCGPDDVVELYEELQAIPAADVVPVDREFESAIISAERYACGRRTYIVGITVDYLIRLLPKLSDWCVDILLQEMNSQRDMAERSGNDELWGDECDKRDWERLISALEKEMERRC